MTKKTTTSLNRRLHLLLLVCFVPLTGMLLYILVMVNRFSEVYDRIIENIASANAYNITFKEELDYNMYIITANSQRAAELIDMEQPHEMIAELRSTFENLEQINTEKEAKTEIRGILRNLENLENHVYEIERDSQVVGKYDTNMKRLDMDIHILTDLIQEGIQNYIAYEAKRLEFLRSDMRRNVKNAVTISAILLAAILGIAVFTSSRIMKRITEGIRHLQEVSQRAGKGEFDVRADMTNCDEELAELGEGFNQMVERLGDLVEDIRAEQLNIRNMEQKLLQAQINPHFLYNTLDAIVWLAEAGDDKHVIMMVTALSDFFRTTLSKGRDVITVEEERSHIRSYLKIQQFRYQDILQYEIDIPESLYLYQIKKLMLQPLVENALYHGIKNKRGMGRILVKGWKEEDTLYFSVEDNGIGMTPERLEMVRQEITRERKEEPTVFGLYNVAQRIHLNYGKNYGLDIESTYGIGTIVKVRIPALLTDSGIE